METLPHLIYTYATSPYDDWHNLAWGASFILLMFVLVLNIITKVITRKWKIQVVSSSKFNAWFGDNHVVKDVSIGIEKNQVIAVMGPSGCGKTTFLRLALTVCTS